ncbi:hypothetical protein Ocin01_15803 [Orchesella cincta]|uniref:Uncharacterized protein n=1 Tax=Orchesella cincta TaxID=48709 RepID=A0A1D2MD54_ORCCI|nr:hypothetical protein Ocin01_15803 [Orchesella cincta]
MAAKDVSPVAPHPEGKSFLASPVSPTAVCKKEYPSPVTPPEDQSFVQLSSNSRGPSPERGTVAIAASNAAGVVVPPAGIARRLARSDRLDTKRYYTAGVIEDIKKENSADKDASIHKRHSWNYGPQSQNSQHQLAADAACAEKSSLFQLRKHDQYS